MNLYLLVNKKTNCNSWGQYYGMIVAVNDIHSVKKVLPYNALEPEYLADTDTWPIKHPEDIEITLIGIADPTIKECQTLSSNISS